MNASQSSPGLDPESQHFLAVTAPDESTLKHRIPGVRSVLVVLSSRGYVFDMAALRQKILLSYPGATVYFRNTQGDAIGPALSSGGVDLLVDFTGPGERQGWFYARKLRRQARVAVGRDAGLFRKKIYDRIARDSGKHPWPKDILARERAVHLEVLRLAGVTFYQTGDTPPDRGKITPLELPPMQKLA